MKYINEFKEGERVESVYLVAEKQLRTTRTGKPFLSMRLSDKTGAIDAVMWDEAERFGALFEKGDMVGLRADVDSYQGSLQLKVHNLKKVEKTPEYLERIVPTTKRDVDAMAAELTSLALGISDPKVKELVMGFLGDDGFMAAFKVSPAAKGMHHVFTGGLLQHTLKVARLCDTIYREYEATDQEIAGMMSRDILLAGAILHDIGKMEELSPSPGFDYTLKGRLVGHISLGLMSVKEKLDAIEDFPEDAAELIMHLLLSHHGENQFGSPKRPKCMEAFILHHADNLDAKLQGIMEYAAKDTSEGKFTAFHRLYDRYFYKGSPDLYGPEDEAGDEAGAGTAGEGGNEELGF